jgi:hypothetical protein
MKERERTHSAAVEPDLTAGPDEPDAAMPLDPEAQADVLEQRMLAELNAAAVQIKKAQINVSARLPAGSAALAGRSARLPTVAELEQQITTRPYRRGIGRLFWSRSADGLVTRLPPLPRAPTVVDFFALRFANTGNHCLQSANKALKRGADEEVVLACLLHDVAQELICADHGYWGAQLIEPYVSERTAFAIRNHQALRFFADEASGYEYPDVYRRLYGVDYVPEERLQETYRMVRAHRWYDAAREVTVSDLYAFDPAAKVTIEPFLDILGRHFKQPREGLGNDNSPVAHMWRTLANPDAPL